MKEKEITHKEVVSTLENLEGGVLIAVLKDGIILSAVSKLSNHKYAILYDNVFDMCQPTTAFAAGEELDMDLTTRFGVKDIDSEVKFLIVNREEYDHLINQRIKHDIEMSRNSPEDNNLKTITRELKEHGGKMVTSNYGTTKGILVGACSSMEDYYYVFIYKRDGKFAVRYETCVGTFEPVSECTVEELMEFIHAPEFDKVMCDLYEMWDGNGMDVLFTPIYVNHMIFEAWLSIADITKIDTKKIAKNKIFSTI